MNNNVWQILDDEQGEIVICTNLKELSCGFEYDPIARMEYTDDEERQAIMNNFKEIIAAHNSKVSISESSMPKATGFSAKTYK